MIILTIGDIVGQPGIKALSSCLSQLKKSKSVDFVIANGENANGTGITPEQAEDIFISGVDVITLGNHAFKRREIAHFLDDNRYILRPANFSPQAPGRGYAVYETNNIRIKVINLVGRCHMDFGPDNPFLMIDRIISDGEADISILDFHAQASSEKIAMGYYTDGKLSAVFGTHTHVQTADERVFPKGTGYITDIGMTGSINSVLGVKPEHSISYFRGDLAPSFGMADGDQIICGVIFDIDNYGKCTSVERIQIKRQAR